METLANILHKLSDDHRKGLQWFIDHANTEQPWTPSVDNVLLATKAKGIYKPTSMEYALSVRQVLNSSYLDRDPIVQADGTWIYQYHQEGSDPKLRDEAYTNCALLACMRDSIPIGVMRQTQGKPLVRYQVLGVALVVGWEDGYFFLEGFSPEGNSRGRGAHAEIDLIAREVEADTFVSKVFDSENLADARRRVVASILRRQGQKQFRQVLLEAYSGRCAISGCNIVEILEAAHIIPYLGPETNHVSNGILLRADIHTLFDLGKISIDPQTMRVLVSLDLIGTAYEEFSGMQISLPPDMNKWPSSKSLNYQRNWAGL